MVRSAGSTGRHGAIATATLAVVALSLVLGTGGSTFDASLPLHPVDLEALQQFQASIWNDQGLLSDWDTAVHPCAWSGVDCECTSLYPLPVAPHPCPASNDGVYNRVYRLDFGPRKPSNKRLHGTYSPFLGNLSEVRQFYLHVNKFSGTVPPEFGKLEKIQRIIIRDNLLTGTLPPELGNHNPKDIYFDNNYLHGPIPDEWCRLVERPDSILNVVHPSNNEGLCGQVPSCLEGPWINPAHTVGTYLIYPPDESNRITGYCDLTPPLCEAPGCSVNVKPIISDVGGISFDFTGFEDRESGMRGYEWCAGTAPGLCNSVELQPFEGNVTGDGVHVVQHRLGGISLKNGATYYITVVGSNSAGPVLTVNRTSAGMLVDSTPPVPNAIFHTFDCSVGSGESTDRDQFDVCWEHFTERESQIALYEVALVSRDSSLVVDFVPLNTNVTHLHMHELVPGGLKLKVGNEYRALVRATNTAGLTVESYSMGVRIKESRVLSDWKLVLVVVMPTLALATALTYHLVTRRQQRIQAHRSQQVNRAQAMKSVLQQASSLNKTKLLVPTSKKFDHTVERGPNQREKDLAEKDEVVFVFTDLESSTAMANTDGASYQHMQEVHDSLVRMVMEEHGGYEINTQGDAFELVFNTVEQALGFCMQVQEKLLHVRWPDDVLRLPACERQVNQEGLLMFNGPRVRMSVHLARKGEFTTKLHDLSKHLVFDGPAFRFARTLGDTAYGGQVLVSHPAVEQVLPHLHATGSTTLQLLGKYRFGGSKEAMALYQAHSHYGSLVPWRTFPAFLMGAAKVSGIESTLNVVPAETLTGAPSVAVLVLRPGTLSGSAEDILTECVLVLAQQFNGRMVAHSSTPGTITIAFASTFAALSCGSAMQVALTYAKWDYRDQDARQAAGELLFNGPRVAMVVHTSAGLSVATSELASPESTGSDGEMDLQAALPSTPRPSTTRPKAGGMARTLSLSSGWSRAASTSRQSRAQLDDTVTVEVGPGELDPWRLASSVHGGQLVVTDTAWEAVHSILPPRCQCLSLGTYIAPGMRSVSLVEVVPRRLSARAFPSEQPGLQQVSPGYLQSPTTAEGVAIVFCKAYPPLGVEDETDPRLAPALSAWAEVCRSTLERHRGYECKEPDPGKFTLAFQHLSDAVHFAAAAQAAVRSRRWPDVYGEAGLRVGIGVAFGNDLFRKPLATGRADYFGGTANLAARVLGNAHPGQALVDFTDSPSPLQAQFSGPGDKHDAEFDGVRLRLRSCGVVVLKGVDEPKLVVDVSLADTEEEQFPPPKSFHAPRMDSAMRVSRSLSRKVRRPSMDLTTPSPNNSASGIETVDAFGNLSETGSTSGFFRKKRHGSKSHDNDVNGEEVFRTSPDRPPSDGNV